MAFQSVGGEEGGEKRVHQIFQRRGSRDIDFREKESSGIPGCEDEICTSHAATSRIFTLRPALLPPFPPLHSFPLPFHPFSHCPEEKRKRLRSFASGPQLRPPIISTCLLLPRRNAYIKRNKRSTPRSSTSSSFSVYSVCGRHARPRDEE